MKILFLLLLAFIAAGLTAWLAQEFLQSQLAQPETAAVEEAPDPQVEMTWVLVAAIDLPAGTILKETHVEWQSWPRDGVDDRFVRRETRTSIADIDIVGAVVRQGLVGGTPIMERHVVQPGDRGFLAAILSPGMRAVSVPVDASSGVAGLIFPGDRVDVLLTHRVKGSEGPDVEASETVLRDVRILGLDQRTEDIGDERRVASTATLEVTPKQAETLGILRQLGRLSLSLRSLAREEGEERDAGPTFTTDREVSAVLARRVSAPAKAAATPRAIEIIRGGDSEILSLDNDEATQDQEEDAP